jgi:type IV secretion system protein TrbC
MSPSRSLRAFTRQLAQSISQQLPSTGVAGLQRIHRLVQPARQGLLTGTVMLSVAGTAKAAGSSMPWEGPLQSILDSIQGPVARIVAVIIIIATGLALAFGDTSGGFRKLIQIVFGLSIAFAASSFFLSFFSFSGGALV